MRVALRDRLSRAASWWNHAPTGQSFRTGFLDVLPTLIATGTWGLVMGIALVKSGLTDSMATLMTVLVYAGSAQDRKSTRLNPVTNAHLVCRLLIAKKKHSIKQDSNSV